MILMNKKKKHFLLRCINISLVNVGRKSNNTISLTILTGKVNKLDYDELEHILRLCNYSTGY